MVSVLYALSEAHVPLGGIESLLHMLPLYAMGFGWLCVAAAMLLLSLLLHLLLGRRKPDAE